MANCKGFLPPTLPGGAHSERVELAFEPELHQCLIRLVIGETLRATLETCLSSESGIQSFTAIRVARSSSAAITLLGLDFEKGQGAHDLSTSKENHGLWQPGTISRKPLPMLGHLRL